MPRIDAVTLKQLRALVAVAETGSITAAAQVLGLTAPAVHTQLKSLETALNCRVLDRAGSGHGGARLTTEGAAVVDAARRIEVTLGACADKVRALRSGKTGVVVLGVVSTAKYFAPMILKRLQDSLPEIEVILKVGNRDFVIEALSDRSIELAVMGRPPRAPAVTATPLGDHPHVLIAAPDHPLAGAEAVAPADLLAQTFIGREEGSGTRILASRYLDRVGEGMPYRLIEMGSNETIKQAVIAGLGIALISRHTVTEELRSGRLVTLAAAGMPIVRQWFVVHRADLTLTPVLRTVFDFVLGHRDTFLPPDPGAPPVHPAAAVAV